MPKSIAKTIMQFSQRDRSEDLAHFRSIHDRIPARSAHNRIGGKTHE